MHNIDFYSGSRNKNQGGGAIRNPKQIEEIDSIDFYSGSKKKKTHGGGGAIRNPKHIQV